MSEETATSNTASLKLQAAWHGTAFVAAVILWGAGDSWAQYSSLAIAPFFSVLASMVFGVAISHIFHEWSHFFGAVISKAKYTVKPKPGFLFFDFDYLNNSRSQLLSMSIGGTVGNVLLVALILLTIPLDSPGRAMLLAAASAMLVYVAVLEWPVIQKLRGEGEALALLTEHFGEGASLFDRALRYAVVVAVVMWLLLPWG